MKIFLSDSDEEDIQQLMAIYINMQNNGFLKKKPRVLKYLKVKRTPICPRALNGHPMTCFDLLRLALNVATNFYQLV